MVAVGEPQGVALSGGFPYLTAGDVTEMEIDWLGRQHQKLVTA
jgi:2,4-didehydro-3-deoxy-L-rhamnonate hydrolase